MRRHKKKGILMIGIMICFLLFGCGTEQATISEETAQEAETVSLVEEETSRDIQFTDLAGREVVLEDVAERVFLGFYAESYYAINGSFDNVVCIAKGEWEDFFNAQYMAYESAVDHLENIIDTGSVYKGSFSMEATLSLKPDVAILAPFQYETLGENIHKLEESGITVVVVDYNAQQLESHLESTQIIGLVTGNEQRAAEINKLYQESVLEVMERVESLTEDEKKKVYVELGNLGAQEYGNSYGPYMWGSLVMMAGGNNIAADRIESFGALSPEYILTENPEVIFLAGSRWVNDTGNRVKVGFDVQPEETMERIEPYTKRPGWGRIKAIEQGDVYAVDHAGLRSVYDFVYLQFIAKSIYPELFEDIDPLENLEDFYKQYLPVTPEGTFMVKYES
ncbi:ABC transporter substrate-binding protein [Tindallia californiensis]|uniref:ABC-type Fe3+-hydroxamate transport system, substrate-binding protein n=1 Tax=Tindallia californiensis TaxID=159292 RepID=A0A1H3QFU0_9FIRM|nr:ABC transporter substrate-binding protein [Tindallia californiensis]SDZ11589.1 ABC-type Fe3+-hydroxamate transport system, substrate-binding protein [Tindallia californiensis]